MKRILLICLFGLLVNIGKSQELFKYNDTLGVLGLNGDTLTLPWLGGLNHPQYSKFDFNDKEYLFIFDRYSKKVVLLERTEQGWKRDYYNEQWFPDMTNWALLRDFDGDGKQDLFTGMPVGIAVYKNVSEGDQLAFDLLISPLLYTSSSNTAINVYVPITDIPVIDDIDGDGDLDVLSFGVLGGTVEWYENKADELAKTDSLYLVKSSSCWGGFEESGTTNDLNLNACDQRSASGSRHSGSTLMSFDPNGDGKKDLLIGDISFNNLVYLENEGDPVQASFSQQVTDWPSNSVSVDVEVFPAAYEFDVDQDNDQDILVANNSLLFDGRQSTWYYQNENGQYTLKQKDFLQDQSLDFGEGANPYFLDVDGDSLIDILVANNGVKIDDSDKVGRIAYLRNIGTKERSFFQLVDEDWSELAQYFLQGLDLTFADLNNDAIPEMLIGDADGALHLFEKDGGDYVLVQSNFQSIRVNRYACPTFFDIDEDGDQDLFIGDQKGKIHFYENNSSGTIYQFDEVSDYYMQVLTKADNSLYGYANPTFYQGDSVLHLLVASYTGTIYDYVFEGDSFVLATKKFSSIFEGERSSIAIADINGDDYSEALVGSYRGGLGFYTLTDSVPEVPAIVYVHESLNHQDVYIYPNPSLDRVNVQASTEIKEMYLTNLNGQILLRSNQLSFDISQLPKGIYLLKILMNEQIVTKKIMKN